MPIKDTERYNKGNFRNSNCQNNAKDEVWAHVWYPINGVTFEFLITMKNYVCNSDVETFLISVSNMRTMNFMEVHFSRENETLPHGIFMTTPFACRSEKFN